MIGTKSFENPLSEMHHALRAPRRRTAVQIMSGSKKATVAVRSLARQIAANENDVPTSQATGEPYRNVYNALSQTHLPTLAAAGIIIYDPKRQKVSAGANLDVASIIIKMTTPTVQLLFDEKEHATEDTIIGD